MAKVTRKPGVVLYPVPVVLVSCGTGARASRCTARSCGRTGARRRAAGS